MHKRFSSALSVTLLTALLAVPAAAAPAAPAAPASAAPAQPYPYGGPVFTQLVADSYRQAHAPDPQTFYAWMDKDCRRIALGGATDGPGWAALLPQKRHEIAGAGSPALKAQRQRQAAAWLHKTIKAALPHFSLDEGFEFTNAVRKGERQCVLQATLMASLLQAMDVDAGVVMVYKNIAGQSSNNGHAVTLMKCADGRDVLVDCSDPTPFVRHQGLFVADAKTGGYRYVEPVYSGADAAILAYRPDGEAQKIPTAGVSPLDARFVRSQIEYYRGERVPGGLLAARPTPEGLAAEARHLRTSIAFCPQNPLAEYMLGRVYIKQARPSTARRQLAQAHALYARFGMVPQGCLDAMNEAKTSQAKL